jgi:hypothetical protein
VGQSNGEAAALNLIGARDAVMREIDAEACEEGSIPGVDEIVLVRPATGDRSDSGRRPPTGQASNSFDSARGFHDPAFARVG